MITIESESLKVTVKKAGGELDSVYSKDTGLEYLWCGDPAFWPRKSPVLFPIVGQLKDNRYIFRNQTYSLPRHGFARDMNFECTGQSDRSATMTLTSDENTLKVYPFVFRLDIIYTVNGNKLDVEYRVTNPSEQSMFFSIGAHPAFRMPLEEGMSYYDYYLEFERVENARRWLISREGLIEPVAVPYVLNDTIIPLSKEMFQDDAIVFKFLNSDVLKIKTSNSAHGIEFFFPRFPFLALWAAPKADFICIEPWCGIADDTQSKHDFISKEGIQLLTGGQTFERTWSVRCY